jgi:hypothetical protein
MILKFMSKQHLLSPELAAHHKGLIAREAVLLLGVMFVALLLQVGGHQAPVLVLDGVLISAGLMGLLAAIFLRSLAYRWWFIALSGIAVIAGMIQLFWSSGLAVGFLILIAIPPIGDAIANFLILARQIWLEFRGGE